MIKKNTKGILKHNKYLYSKFKSFLICNLCAESVKRTLLLFRYKSNSKIGIKHENLCAHLTLFFCRRGSFFNSAKIIFFSCFPYSFVLSKQRFKLHIVGSRLHIWKNTIYNKLLKCFGQKLEIEMEIQMIFPMNLV